MWYTNGWSMTSGNVNSFHNWAGSWRINSYTTFRNYNNPYGASYSRINMREDNITFWYAHQSDDECYNNVWYYCYIGRPFHHSIGAYTDAYWEWDWFNSGWRNWHSSSDGLISEYRSKRYANNNPYPRLTSNAGDFNSRVRRNANHSSLWENGENHFTTEVMPYLNLGLYGGNWNKTNSSTEEPIELKEDDVKNRTSQILASNGNMYFGKNNITDFIVEEDNKIIEFVIYGDSDLKYFELINKRTNQKTEIEIIESKKDAMSGAYVAVANASNLLKGEYILKTNSKDFLLLANNKESSTAFAVNLNFNEKEGYNGEVLEVGIANKDNAIDFTGVSVIASLSEVGLDHDKSIELDKVKIKQFTLRPSKKEGMYAISFPNLNSGSIYSLRIEAKAKSGKVLLSRNIVKTFYVKKDIQTKDISVKDNLIPTMKKGLKSSNSMINLEIYPNPASSFVTIRNGKEMIDSIELMDLKGGVLDNISINNVEYKLNLQGYNLSKGLYLLKVITKTGVTVEKLIIE